MNTYIKQFEEKRSVVFFGNGRYYQVEWEGDGRNWTLAPNNDIDLAGYRQVDFNMTEASAIVRKIDALYKLLEDGNDGHALAPTGKKTVDDVRTKFASYFEDRKTNVNV